MFKKIKLVYQTVYIFAQKMRRAILFSLFLTIIFTNCTNETSSSSEASATEDMTEQLLGTWEIKDLKIDIATHGGSDTSSLLDIKEEQWIQVYALQPYRTFFAADSTFRTVRRVRDGTLLGEDRGLWRTFGDTLMLIQPNATFQYKVLLSEGKAEWAGVIDWDQDGQEDDTYYATFRYVGRTSNE